MEENEGNLCLLLYIIVHEEIKGNDSNFFATLPGGMK